MSRQRRILVVEDGLISEQMAKFALQSLGNVDIDSIDTGEAALQLLHTRQYDIIFMDLGLPGINGIQTTKQIRKYEEEHHTTTHVPIIALTAQTGASAASASLKAGMNGFIPKPLTPDKAQEALDKWVA
jgi:CheY-like chemotaxis protein